MVKLSKPYVSKVCEIRGFSVWVVDGFYIRSNIDEEFTNFGQHYRFGFIPKDELWVDKEYSNNEMEYYITHMLMENRLMAEKIKDNGTIEKRAIKKIYDDAIEKADLKEIADRKKSEFYKKTIGEKKLSVKETIGRIHRKLLRKYSKKIDVWVINGELVRDLFFVDFTEGGHDKVYNFIPENEIWLDDDISLKERGFVLLHEICERNEMAGGKEYNPAHFMASSLEHYCRMNPDELEKHLQDEFRKAEECGGRDSQMFG